ncbi:MAG: hypothetical protein HY927_16245 [Elusimicrobia bacterium]|nr:hypothetical protein [Elusimicrobiota bacterium]
MLRRGLVLPGLSLLLCAACQRQAPPEVSRRTVLAGIEKANAGDAGGLKMLYEVFVDERRHDAEHRSAAKVALDNFLYLRTQLWVDAFADSDPKTFDWPRLSLVDMPPGVEDLADLRAKIKDNLLKLDAAGRKKEFVDLLLERLQPTGIETSSPAPSKRPDAAPKRAGSPNTP